VTTFSKVIGPWISAFDPCRYRATIRASNTEALELSEKIKHIRPDISVILCSGFAEQVSEMSLKQLGIATIVRKPIGRNGII
jgi:hypothetical protein